MPKIGNTGGSYKLLPEGEMILEVINVEEAEPSKLYPNSKRLFIEYAVPDELHDTLEVDSNDERISAGATFREYFGLTLGPANKRSRLFDRVISIMGKASAPQFEKWLAGGGEFDFDWLFYCRIRVEIVHNVDAQERTWTNISEVIRDKELLAENAKRIFAAMRKDDVQLYDATIGVGAQPVAAAPKRQQTPANVTRHPVPEGEPAEDLVF